MRGIFSIVGLLVVVAIIGVLAKKQLSASSAKPAVVDGSVLPAPDPARSPQQQTQQIRQALDGAMQARPMPEDR